jgi:Uma2 family endonuclease
MAVNPKYIQSPELLPAVPSDPIWRFTVDQYHQMILAGIFMDDDPVELLEGWLVPKMPKKPPHTTVTQLVRDLIARLLVAEWFVNDQEPITTGDSEPEPDVTIIRGDRRQFFDRHPGPMDVGLVIEVADATLKRDRSIKKRLYARADIPVYWIINLTERQIEVYTSPSGADYKQRHDYFPDDEVPLVLDGNEIGRIAVKDLLP